MFRKMLISGFVALSVFAANISVATPSFAAPRPIKSADVKPLKLAHKGGRKPLNKLAKCRGLPSKERRACKRGESTTPPDAATESPKVQ